MDGQENKLKDIKQKKNTDKFKKKINEDLNKKLINNQKKINDINLRHAANIENIKKNTQIKIEKIKNSEIENFIKKNIFIIDALENTLITCKKLNISDKPLIQGINLTLKSLLKMLCKFGMKIEGHFKEPFNPEIHDVIEIQESNTIKPNHIISVNRKGFTFNNILLRKASVIISKN